jgi:hypothetical protein
MKIYIFTLIVAAISTIASTMYLFNAMIDIPARVKVSTGYYTVYYTAIVAFNIFLWVLCAKQYIDYSIKYKKFRN